MVRSTGVAVLSTASHREALRSIGRHLAARRRELALTQEQLGRRIGVSQFQVSEWEHGKRDLRTSTLIRLACALGLELRIECVGAPPRIAVPLAARGDVMA